MLPREEAERRYDAYRAAGGDRLREFIDAVGAEGGPKLDFSADSLRPLWPWLLQQAALQEGAFPQDAHVPPWMTQPVERLTPETVWLAGGAAYYLVECILRHVPGTRWELGHDPMPHWDQEYRPIVVGLPLEVSPPFVLSFMLERALERPGQPPANPADHPDSLFRFYQRAIGEIPWAQFVLVRDVVDTRLAIFSKSKRPRDGGEIAPGH